MFEAWIMVCALANPNECVEFQDIRGLHKTQLECKVRAHEMAVAVAPTFAFPIDIKWKCVTVPGQKI